MRIRSKSILWLSAAILGLAAGCKESATEVPKAPKAPPAPPSPQYSFYRHHFVGASNLESDTNAAPLLSVAAKPDSIKLRDQTLNKLAGAPYQLLRNRVATTNSHSALIQPLLRDLLRFESFAEIRGASNDPSEFVLAVRLDEAQAQTWQTNLATVLGDWTGVQPVDSQFEGFTGWELKQARFPARIRFVRANQWVVFSAEDEKSQLSADYAKSIKGQGVPALSNSTAWVELALDWPHFQTALPFRLPLNLPRMDLFLTSSNQNLRTRVEMTFPEPFPSAIEPWDIPTNLIREPIISFTALQGTESLFSNLPPFSEFKFSPRPSQVYFWGLYGIPFQEYAAARVPEATNVFEQLVPQLVSWAKPKIPTNCGALLLTNNSLVWTGLVAFSPPHLEPSSEAGRQYLVAGLYAIPTNTRAAPPELFQQVLGRSNLVYYDWEITQEKLKQWLFLDDTRHVFFDANHRPHMRGDLATMRWFSNCLTNLGNTVTEVTRVGGNQLTLVRKSPVGFTGIELDRLANWLENPDFPWLGYALPPQGNAELGRKN